MTLAPHAIVFAAAIAATVTGYGFVLLASPLLLFLLSPAEAVPLSITLGWLVISTLVVRPAVWRQIDRTHVLRLAGAGILGIPLGTSLLLALDAQVLRILLGTVIAGLALISLSRMPRAARHWPRGAPPARRAVSTDDAGGRGADDRALVPRGAADGRPAPGILRGRGRFDGLPHRAANRQVTRDAAVVLHQTASVGRRTVECTQQASVGGAGVAPRAHPRQGWGSWLPTLGAGFCGGVLSGCAGLGGSLLVLYLARFGMEKQRLRATLAATIWFTSSVTLLMFVVAGRYPSTLGKETLLLVPALLAGMVVGNALFGSLPEQRFRQFALLFAAAAGTTTALTGALSQ